MIFAQVNKLTQSPDIPDLPFDDSQPDSRQKRAAFERYMENLDIQRMSQTVLETVRKIDALADHLEPLTQQSKQQKLDKLAQLEAENAALGAQLEALTAQAGLSPYYRVLFFIVASSICVLCLYRGYVWKCIKVDANSIR